LIPAPAERGWWVDEVLGVFRPPELIVVGDGDVDALPAPRAHARAIDLFSRVGAQRALARVSDAGDALSLEVRDGSAGPLQ